MRSFAQTCLSALCLSTTVSATWWLHPHGEKSDPYNRPKGKDYDYTGFTQNQTERAELVIEMFRFAWNGYYEHAFPNDDLLPLNNSHSNSRNGWGVTAVDALSTAIVLEQADIVNTILDFIPSIDFTQVKTKTVTSVSVFETNIRYLGGLLSSYDLLKGPFSHLNQNATNIDALLTQAKSLADTLKFAFDTPSGIPVNNVWINNKTFTNYDQMADGTQTNGLATIGTLILEWQRLSDLTGDQSYAKLVQKAESYWLNPKPATAEVHPGLTGGNFSVQTGEILDQAGGFTGGYDSAYEYAIKMFVYDPDRYAAYGDWFAKSADSAIKYLQSHPARRPDLTFVTIYDGLQTFNETGQLACFLGGSYLLGAQVKNRPDWFDFGLKLAEFCANGYRETASGIGPIIYSWNETAFLTSGVAGNQSELYTRAGFWVDPAYLFNGQAPEAIESWYYAYQYTNDQYWRDVSWAYTLATNRSSRAGVGFSSLNNVLAADGEGTQNFMASYMLAEVFKYMYLVQTPKRGPFHVAGGKEGENVFVFNTECHPIRVANKAVKDQKKRDLTTSKWKFWKA